MEPEAKWGKIWIGGWWPKVSIFYWLVIKRCILTWDNLQIKGIYGPSRCCMCEENNEPINHLLDECKVEESIWEKGADIFRKNHHHKGRPNFTIAEWPMNCFKNKIVNASRSFYLALLYGKYGKPAIVRPLKRKKGNKGKYGIP